MVLSGNLMKPSTKYVLNIQFATNRKLLISLTWQQLDSFPIKGGKVKERHRLVVELKI